MFAILPSKGSKWLSSFFLRPKVGSKRYFFSFHLTLIGFSSALSAQTLVEYDHTAGSSAPSFTETGVTSSASLGGSFTGAVATTIDQFSGAAGNSLPNANIPATNFNYFFTYSVSGSNLTYDSLSLDVWAKDIDRRFQASYMIGAAPEIFLTTGQTIASPIQNGQLNDDGNFDNFALNFTTSDTVKFNIYWQGSANNNAASRVYVDDFLLYGFLPIAPGVVAVVPTAAPKAPVILDVIDTGAISQLVSSAIPMNLAVGQAASNIHNVSNRSLNRRIQRLRSKSDESNNQISQQSPSAVRVSYLMAAAGVDLPLVSDSGKASISHDSVTYGPSAKEVLDPDVVASGENWSVYASADFGMYDVDPLAGSSGLESDTYASTAGIEYIVNENWAVGAGLSHVWSNNSLHNGLGGFDIEGNAAMTYVSYFKNNFWGDLLYSYGSYGGDIHRNTLLGSTVRAEPDLESHQATLNLGYNLTAKKGFVHGPTFRADQGWGTLEGYTERGDARANTMFREQDYESLVTTLGWQINWETDTARGVKLRPNFRLGYGRENLDQETKVSGTLEQSPFYKVNADTGAVLGSGATVTNSLRRVDPGDGWMEVGAGLGVEFSNRFGIYADYQGRVFQDAAQLHLGTVKASWKW